MQPSNREVLTYRAPRGLKIAGVVVVAGLAVLVAVGVMSRSKADQDLKGAAKAQSIPIVELVSAQADKGALNLMLPADVQALENATIHSRVPGYLKRWGPDIGARVKRGQVLAEIDTPDLDQQLARARADLNTATANQTLSRSTEARWKALLAQDAVSQQEYDEKAGDLAAKISLVAASRANLAQLQATAAFKRVVAPFDGVVTQRSTDIGELVAAGGGGEPLYTIADVSKLRIYVRVPQTYTLRIKPGMTAELHAPERPDQAIPATVVNDSQAINPQSGTLLVQLQLDNGHGLLKPGQFVQAEFKLSADTDVVSLPATSLMYGANGAKVAVIAPNGRVKLHPVNISKDLGTRVQIATGLKAGDKVVDNPPDSLLDGDEVKVAAGGKAVQGG